jgi:protein-disulfide isomerase
MKPFLNAAVLVAFLALSVRSYSADASQLKPPRGAKVAIVVFEDLECQFCAATYPVVWEVARAHHVPVVLHDFPLPSHPWSFEAAIDARFFDTKSEKIGNDFRGYIYQNQAQINRDNLREYVLKFADNNKVPLPFVIDPELKLKALVQADYALGQRMGLIHTPTIFVIGKGRVSSPFVEVADRDQLTQVIEDMQKKAGSGTPTKTASKTKKKKIA